LVGGGRDVVGAARHHTRTAIRAGLIHGLSVTGPQLEESLFSPVAMTLQDFPEYRYFTKQDDTGI